MPRELTAETTTLCDYCGCAVAKNRRPYIGFDFFADGWDFVGHRSCYMKMRYPDDLRYGRARHNIKEGT